MKLLKALHGSKQAPRAWNSKLNKVLIKMGFVRSKNDYAVYYETRVEGRLIIGVYVKDIIIMGSNSHKIIKFKEAKKKVLEITNLGVLSSSLGIEIEHGRRSYIENILNMFKMSDCSSVKTPMEFWLKLVNDGRGETKKSFNIQKSHW